MIHALMTLNYVAALVAAVIGFLIGWLWYSPLLFVKPWLAEMKFTEAEMKAAQAKGMAKIMLTAFACTIVYVAAVGVRIKATGPRPSLKAPNWAPSSG